MKRKLPRSEEAETLSALFDILNECYDFLKKKNVNVSISNLLSLMKSMNHPITEHQLYQLHAFQVFDFQPNVTTGGEFNMYYGIRFK